MERLGEFLRWIGSWFVAPATKDLSPIDANRATRCQQCQKEAAAFIWQVEARKLASEGFFCMPCGKRPLTGLLTDYRKPTGSIIGKGSEVPLGIRAMIGDLFGGESLLLLREVDGPRLLPISIGYSSACLLYYSLKGDAQPRPLTHHAWAASLIALGACVKEACITERHDWTFHAELRLVRGADTFTVDLRPSDALLVALTAEAPFLVREELLADSAASGWTTHFLPSLKE